MQTRKSSCVQCGKSLEYTSCFPQDEEDWASDITRNVRCGECWDKFIQTDVMTEMQEQIQKKNSKKTGAPKEKKQEKDNATDKKSKKRKRRTECKCGSKDHVSIRHLDCPLNPRNLRKQPEASSTPTKTPSATETRKRKRRTECKCGSKDHVSIRHLDCPLNPRNLRKQPEASSTPTKTPSAPKTPVDNKQPEASSTPTKTPSAPETPADNKQPEASSSPTETPSAPETPATVKQPQASPAKAVRDKLVTPPQPLKQTRPSFRVNPVINDSVIARFERNKWFLAHVTGIDNGKYTLYFMCGEVRTRPLSQLRPLPPNSTAPRRTELLHKVWWFEGAHDLAAGLWKVRQIQGNEYRCTRVSGGTPNCQNVENFDIGYVIRCYTRQEEEARERGPRSSSIHV